MLYELPMFQHIDAESVEEALFWLHQYGDKAKMIAGGTDLLGLMKDRITGPKLLVPEILVNVKPIRELNQINYDDKRGLRIGSTITLNNLENSEVIRKYFNILLMASRQIGTTQIRNMGTVGGNVCQRPRCLYFRHPHFLCYKKGGTMCHAATGEHRDYHSILRYGRCVMAHPSDMAPALIALKAKILIAGQNQDKEIPLGDFFVGANHLNETILRSDELVRGFRVQKQQDKTYQVFLKHRLRHASDFSLISVAVVIQIVEQLCHDVTIVLGGIAPFPYLVPHVEEFMRGKVMSGELIAKVAEISVEEARPLPMNHYKIDMTKALLRQALGLIWDDIPSHKWQFSNKKVYHRRFRNTGG